MTSVELSGALLEALDRATDKGDWRMALVQIEHLLGVVAHPRNASDASLMESVAAAAAERAAKVTMINDISAEPSPAAAAWLLRAAATTAEAARREIQPREDGDTRTRILDALAAAGADGLSNVELARACRRSEETISRALRVLRGEGTVGFRSVGRQVRNWLITEGQRAETADDAQAILVREEPLPALNSPAMILDR